MVSLVRWTWLLGCSSSVVSYGEFGQLRSLVVPLLNFCMRLRQWFSGLGVFLTVYS